MQVDAYYQSKKCDEYEQGKYHGARQVLVNIFTNLEKLKEDHDKEVLVGEKAKDKQEREAKLAYQDFLSRVK